LLLLAKTELTASVFETKFYGYGSCSGRILSELRGDNS